MSTELEEQTLYFSTQLWLNADGWEGTADAIWIGRGLRSRMALLKPERGNASQSGLGIQKRPQSVSNQQQLL